jgi:hypothetical protein
VLLADEPARLLDEVHVAQHQAVRLEDAVLVAVALLGGDLLLDALQLRVAAASACSKRSISASTSSAKIRRSCTSTGPPRKWAMPTAIPGEAPTPRASILPRASRPAAGSTPSSKPPSTSVAERRHGGLGVGPLGHDHDLHPERRHQREQAHDALAVDLRARP